MTAGHQDVLVTGGTGKTGALVARRLGALGHAARIAARRPGPGGVRFDWTDPSTYADAVSGVTAAYLVAPVGVADPLPLMSAFIDEAMQRGVRRFVLLSASSLPEDGPAMGAVHGYLRRHAPEWAVLQPSWFMQNFSEGLHRTTIRDEDVIFTATGRGRVPFIDADDVAVAAVRALVDAEPANRAFLLTGPEALGYDDVASIIGRHVGRPIRHVGLSPAALAERLERAGIPGDFARMLARMDDAIAAGAEDRTTPEVRELSGRTAGTFDDFARRNAALWRRSPSPGVA